MKVFAAPERQKIHYPRNFLVNGAQQPNPEKPERVDRLLAAAGAGGHDIAAPADHGLGPIAAVHTPEYLRFLENIYERWARIPGASDEVIPNIHPDRREASYPLSAVGQAGYHMADTACPIGPDSWAAIRWSANCAASAAEAVLDGAPAAYALCRPPGHHAFADLAGGFCFVNNAAVAAMVLRRQHARVAVVDVDLHHGNGTQGIFYKRDDVLTVSVHADPIRFYPFFWGHAHERGEGVGTGYNLNLPLPRGSEDAAFLEALDRGLETVAAFAPGALVVALGLDAFEDDPFGGLAVSTAGFGRIGARLAALGLPSVIVQEGGYLCDGLGDNLAAFLGAFEADHKTS
ncbi:histone deacetylase family protein [Pelagibius sp. CAU 1746]|uniref:histone deacetylase family protein n=1 Tax=Pelagibius sp. CAU 1746 TaxID=3140370 RepID=UPI00325C0906